LSIFSVAKEEGWVIPEIYISEHVSAQLQLQEGPDSDANAGTSFEDLIVHGISSSRTTPPKD
jgi:hypothetical protein